MKEIQEDIINDVEIITNEVVKYNNIDNLSWMEVYNDVLTKLNMNNRDDKDILLTNVVTMITRLGYDIEAIPFELKKY
ncbi:MAG: hypothetical protein IJZ46_02670 [Bacilli bacterium]|nr:hypothetical protein [Bacilli bacterium]